MSILYHLAFIVIQHPSKASAGQTAQPVTCSICSISEVTKTFFQFGENSRDKTTADIFLVLFLYRFCKCKT
jgi:hypothetical protein